MNKNVFNKTVFERWRATVIYAVGILGYMLMVTAVYPTYKKMLTEKADLLKNYPKGLLQLFGVKNINASSFTNYITLELLGFIWVIIMVAFVVAFARNMISGELKDGTLELLMSQPVPRWKILTSEGMAMLAGIVGLVVTTVLGVIVFGSAFASSGGVNYAGLAAFIPVGICLATAIAGYSVLFTVLIKDPRRVIMASVGLTLYFYLIHFAAGYSKIVDKIDWFGIFHYYDPFTVIERGTVPAKSVLVLLAFTAVGFGAAIWAFQHKDIKQ
ncbi:MAG TPA: ABC transporter permease subunit [Candidatus Anoxymicrobiaceae bacterium]